MTINLSGGTDNSAGGRERAGQGRVQNRFTTGLKPGALRLDPVGLLREEAEERGRRRRVFHLTDAGHHALLDWLADPATPEPETRNPALLKLTFADLGAPGQIAALARAQAAQHRHWRDTYRQLREHLDPDAPDTPARARLITLGIAHEQSYTTFWEALAADPDGTGEPAP
jgi:DNA-binding PadR family transcriptional regulator